MGVPYQERLTNYYVLVVVPLHAQSPGSPGKRAEAGDLCRVGNRNPGTATERYTGKIVPGGEVIRKDEGPFGVWGLPKLGPPFLGRWRRA